LQTLGQTGDTPELYRVHGLDLEAILNAMAGVLVPRA
jgi:hypothetical protein